MKKSILVIACWYLLLSAAAVFAQDSHAGHDHSPKAGNEATSRAAETGTADKDYPLEICVVSEMPLDSMGEPVKFEYMGRTFLLCCENCIEAIKADPDKYIKKLTDAYAEAEKNKVHKH